MKPVARSLLFVPGDRPDRFDKAAASGAHQVIIDLEDAVAPSAKSAARDAVATWLAQGHSAAVRINAADTPWFADDLDMIRSIPAATVMLPKADADSLSHTSAALPGCPLIALIETVRGYMDLRQLGSVRQLTRMAFGSVDFGVETGIADESDAMTAIRTQIVLESCYGGLVAPIDGVSVNFNDDEIMRHDALRSRQLGFGAKLCIHPRQVAAVNGAFLPTAAEMDWARRVLAAIEASSGAATAVDGKMVDKPVVEQARRLLAEAGAGAE